MVACWTQKEVSGKVGVKRTVTQAGLLAALKPGLLHSCDPSYVPSGHRGLGGEQGGGRPIGAGEQVL